MKLSAQTWILAGICLADLVSTLWLLHTTGAAEANGFMSLFLAYGTGAFAAAKVMFTVIPLAALEWARRHHPQFVRAALNVGVAAYVGFYLIGVSQVNRSPSLVAIERASITDPERIALWSHLEAEMRTRHVPGHGYGMLARPGMNDPATDAAPWVAAPPSRPGRRAPELADRS